MLPRTRNARTAPSREQPSREMRNSRLALFIQQFEKEAQERMNELEAKLENTLSTVDKVFKVELMKMPLSLRNTRIGDLLGGEPFNGLLKSEAVKSEDQSSPTQRPSSKTSKGGKAIKRTRALVGSNSTGNLRGSSVTVKRTQSRVTRNTEQTMLAKRKLRSVVSAGDLHCSMAASAAHVTVTTAQGLTVSFSEETKDDINMDMLDDVALCQIQRLTSLMEYLSQSRCQR